MGSAVSKDIPPYLMVSGNPSAPHGLNKVGLKRRGFSDEQLRNLAKAYRVLYREGLILEEAKIRINALAEQHKEVKCFAAFLDDSQRGIIR